MDSVEMKSQIAELAKSVAELARMVGEYLNENIQLTNRIERIENDILKASGNTE